MSYCRWSDNEHQCDIYAFAHCAGGYAIHVASNRPVLDEPLPPPVPLEEGMLDEWVARHKAVHAWLERAERRPIGLPYDGESFYEGNATDAADRLEMLRDTGYLVPQYAIDGLREEATEEV